MNPLSRQLSIPTGDTPDPSQQDITDTLRAQVRSTVEQAERTLTRIRFAALDAVKRGECEQEWADQLVRQVELDCAELLAPYLQYNVCRQRIQQFEAGGIKTIRDAANGNGKPEAVRAAMVLKEIWG